MNSLNFTVDIGLNARSSLWLIDHGIAHATERLSSTDAKLGFLKAANVIANPALV